MSTASEPYISAPGTDYPFSVHDIAVAVAALLGDGWTSTDGRWGTTALVQGPCLADFQLLIDSGDDLCIEWVQHPQDDFPERPTLPENVEAYQSGRGVSLPIASPSDGLETLAELCAATIRAISAPAAQPPYQPAPGTEYPFSISDIARAAAHQLGDGWSAESGPWGVTGTVRGDSAAQFRAG